MKEDYTTKANRKMKLRFYIISLWLLFAILFLLSINICGCFDSNNHFVGFTSALQKNWLAAISLLFGVVGLFLSKINEHEWAGVSNPPHVIKAIKNENYEYLTFLTTYIIPLICIDLSQVRYVIVLGVLLVLIGYMFVRMDLYYGNPTLALMGYRLYRVQVDGVDSSDGVILITKDQLHLESAIKWIPVDKYVWIAKEIKK